MIGLLMASSHVLDADALGRYTALLVHLLAHLSNYFWQSTVGSCVVASPEQDSQTEVPKVPS